MARTMYQEEQVTYFTWAICDEKVMDTSSEIQNMKKSLMISAELDEIDKNLNGFKFCGDENILTVAHKIAMKTMGVCKKLNSWYDRRLIRQLADVMVSLRQIKRIFLKEPMVFRNDDFRDIMKKLL